MVCGTFLIIAAAQASSTGAGDAHDLRRMRGDVLVVHGKPASRPSAGRSIAEPVRVGDRLPRAAYGKSLAAGAARHPANGSGTRWVRHGSRILLVNVRTGRVLRVAPKR